MHLHQMPIALSFRIKRLQTNPTDMRLTILAYHMIAAVSFLNRHFTHRTILDLVLCFPFPKLLISFRRHALVDLACEAVMVCDLAGGANRSEAGGTGEDGAIGGDAVDRLAVWCRTVLEVFGICPNVRGERVL